ncbi:MAG: hypothetical protein AAF845_16430 [Bacteroidota bacterium]
MRPAMFAALFLAVAAITQVVSSSGPVAPAPDAPVVSEVAESEPVAVTFAPTETVLRDTVAADTVAADTLAAAPEAAPPKVVEVTEKEAAPPPPTRYASEATGFAITLPAGWTGPSSVTETDLPAYAHYTFSGAASGSALAGVTLHVERIVGLNALDQQRWTRGLTPYGYHGLEPVGPASVPVAGLGIELSGGGQAGAVAFVQRGQTFWAVHVQAPEAAWASRRTEILSVLSAVDLP